jgi:hypothetical protein
MPLFPSQILKMNILGLNPGLRGEKLVVACHSFREHCKNICDSVTSVPTENAILI